MANPDVLVLTPDFPPDKGGIQVLVHRIVSSWTRLDPRVITLRSQDAEGFDEGLAFPVHRVGYVRAGHRARLAALNAVAAAVGVGRRPDAVLSGHIVMSPAAWLITRTLRIPFVQYLHGQELAVRPKLASFAVRHAAASVAVSRHTEKLAADCGAPAARVRRIHPGVDLASSNSTSPKRSDIVVVARLDERYKGHDVLIRALPLVRSRVPDARLVIVGDGVLRGAYENLARSFGVADSVVFMGAVDEARRDVLLQEASVFAMPSRRLSAGAGEGFGIVFLEAGTRHLPVVAGAVAGTLDAVVDGETGLLVDPEDHLAVADAVTRLLLDPGLARRLGDNGARRAEGFAWPSVGAAVEDVLLELLETR
jgi:phosphatidylinositol alpha-1,6-mannosyltransferase